MKTKPFPSKIISVNDVLTFGKHKGLTVDFVLESDPAYIVWLEEEKICEVEQEIYNLAQECDEENSNDWG
ncbi:hypothetical protein KW795_03020, partial [Candidatus Microgenomates bacterium]|nr:hypothetical protein [Candidatus Microgenomates bacterium]